MVWFAGKKKTDRISSAVVPFAPSYVIARADEMENGEKKILPVASSAASCRYRLAENRLFASGTLVAELPTGDAVIDGDRFLFSCPACADGFVVHPAASRRQERSMARIIQFGERRFIWVFGKAVPLNLAIIAILLDHIPIFEVKLWDRRQKPFRPKKENSNYNCKKKRMLLFLRFVLPGINRSDPYRSPQNNTLNAN